MKANEPRSILLTTRRGYMFDLRDAFAAREVRRQAGGRAEEEEEAEERTG